MNLRRPVSSRVIAVVFGAPLAGFSGHLELLGAAWDAVRRITEQLWQTKVRPVRRQ